MKTIHYAGGMEIHGKRYFTKILSGWAACCSGIKAEKIAAEHNHTYDKARVTCKACLHQIEREQEGKARRINP